MRQRNPIAPLFAAEARFEGIEDAWEVYQEASKYRRNRYYPRPPEDRHPAAAAAAGDFIRGIPGMPGMADMTGNSFRAHRQAPRVELPLAVPRPRVDVDQAIRTRRTPQGPRYFAETPLPLPELARLLALGAGITHTDDGGRLFRAAPSAGGLYELETYVFAARVAGLEPGLYHYDVRGHALEKLRGPEAVADARRSAILADSLSQAAAVIVLTSVIGRLAWKYGERAYRLTLLDAGHLGENLCVAAAGAGLASLPYGAYLDDELAEALRVDGVTELIAHVVLLGAPTETPRATAAPGAALLRDPAALPGITWQLADEKLRDAFGKLARGRTADARRALIECAAVLPGDRTLADYLRWADAPGEAVLAQSTRVHYAFPPDWSEATRSSWIARAEAAAAQVAQWFELDVIPTTLIDFTARAPAPITLTKERPVQRKIVWPADAERWANDLTHELAHGCYVPRANRFLAEGIAIAASADADELDVLDARLAEETAPPVSIPELFSADAWSRRFDATDDARPYPVAGSFVRRLVELHGRDKLFELANDLPDGQAEQAARFQAVLGTSLATEADAWWQTIKRGR
jgi:SagB-type dehydrogenase family enzyme